MTQVSDILASVRDVLMDVEGARYTDARLIRGLNIGLREVRSLRPDMFIGRFSQPVWQASSADELFDAPEATIPPLVKYTAGWADMADDEYANDGRASALMTMFKRDLGVPA